MPKKPIMQYNPARGHFRVGSRHYQLPKHSKGRIALGVALIIGGMLGFLPVLGFWMIPLGILVLSQDLPMVRRWRRSLVVKMERRNGKRPTRARASNSNGQDEE